MVVIKGHGAVLRAQEGEKQTYEGGLAGTRLAEDGCAGGGREIERQIVEHLAAVVAIGIGHVAQTHATRTVHAHRRALLLKRVFLKLHQSLGSGEHAHKGGHQFGQATRRTLYLVDQLQESGHAAKGERACRHAHGSPEKRHEVAKGEAEVEDEV